MKEGLARFWTIFGILACALLTLLVLEWQAQPAHDAPSPSHREYASTAADARPAPPQESDAQALAPTAAASLTMAEERAPGQRPSAPPLFKCVAGSQVSYSDQPCAAGQKVSLVDTRPTLTGTVAPPKPSPQRPADPAPQTAVREERAEANVQQAHDQQCQKLLDEIARIDSAARAAHSAWESNRLNEARRTATQERFELGC